MQLDVLVHDPNRTPSHDWLSLIQLMQEGALPWLLVENFAKQRWERTGIPGVKTFKGG